MLQLSCAAVICLMLAVGEGKMFLIETKDTAVTGKGKCLNIFYTEFFNNL